MGKSSIYLAVVTALLGFAAGFFLANMFNRSELDNLKVEAEKYKTAVNDTEKSKTDMTLTEDEIKEKIAQADANPDYLAFQRDLGTALYSYASMKQEPKLLQDSSRLLERAVKLSPGDNGLKRTLGNVYFNIGYFEKDKPSIERSRRLYEEILKTEPTNAGVLTDLSATYIYEEPADLDKALSYIKRSLDVDQKDERTLHFAVQASWRSGKTDDAGKYFEQLKAAHPGSRSITELTTLMTQPTSTPK